MDWNVLTKHSDALSTVLDLREAGFPAAQSPTETYTDLRTATILDLFHATVYQHRQQAAISDAQSSISYGQLWDFASAFRTRLLQQGVQPGDLVGVAASRSLPTVAAIIGIMMAGACYVPIDLQEFSASVLVQLAEQSGIHHWIADAPARQVANPDLWQGRKVLSLEDVALPASIEMAEIPPVRLTPESPLYVMYTSGSTGLPKGVVVPHRAVVRLVTGQNFLEFGSQHTFLLHSPLSFDASTLEFWGSLLHGSRLVVAPSGRLGLDDYARIITRQGVTTLWLTAAMFHLAAEHAPEMFAPLSQLIVGGDVISPRYVERVRKLYPALHMVNGYGPTENTTFTCCYVVPADYRAGAALPIGLPIAHTTIHIFDAEHQPVEAGHEGELAAGGAGVALGYLAQPDATAERFLPDTFSHEVGARLYLTGDRVRQRQDGVIEFLGRIDRQVKIAGHRVELAAIESVLSQSPLVSEAAILVLAPASGEKQLVACVSLLRPDVEAERALRSWLAEHLSVASIPQHWMFLEKFPINTNGKLDRNALQGMCEASFLSADIAGTGAALAASQPVDVEDASPTVHYVQRLWAQLLGRASVGAEENFFDLGGSSLLLIEMHARLKAQFEATPSLVEMFAFPTPHSLAERLSRGGEISLMPQTAELRGQRQREAMLARRTAWTAAKVNVSTARKDGSR